MTNTVAAFATVALLSTAAVTDLSGEAVAASSYACPLSDPSGGAPCQSPLVGTVHGDVTPSSDGYLFNPSGDATPGYVEVDNSNIIDTSGFPLQVSVEVMGIKPPSSTVGDYDVVRGTPSGTWKIEIMARNNRTTARAACHFKGTTGKTLLVGGPNLSGSTGWHTITCVDDGKQVQLSVDGTPVKSTSVATGPVANNPPLLIGAKNTTGGDQFSGWARNVTVSGG
jgi:hypothetical protein